MDQIMFDFHAGPDNQNLHFTRHEINDFWNWFGAEAINYEISNDPNYNLINSSNRPGRCFGNAQVIAINNNKSYCEGFANMQGSFNLHGFNLYNEMVEDYTVLSNQGDYRDSEGRLPSEYYGILIPNEFILQHNRFDIENNHMNIPPLLADYFRAMTQNR